MRQLFKLLLVKIFLNNKVTLPARLQIMKRTVIACLLLLSGFHIDCMLTPVIAQEMAGRYKMTGASIRYQVTVPQQKPAAVIVVQYLPPHTAIKNATPGYSTYDPQTGIVKWLFSEVEPGVLTINLQLANPVERNDVKAEVLFKDHSGASSIFAIEPLAMKRKQMEGC